MSQPKNSQNTLSRRSLIKGGAAGVATAAAAALATSESAEAGRRSGRRLRIQVANARFEADFETVTNFVVVGDITMVDGKQATGKYFCKGVFFPGSNFDPQSDADTFVDQRFRIDGVGSILGAGAEGDGDVEGDDLGIIGGTGKFVGASGTYAAVGGVGEGPLPGGNGNIPFEFDIRRGR